MKTIWLVLAIFVAVLEAIILSVVIGYNSALSETNYNLTLERDTLKCEVEIYKTLHQIYANTGKAGNPNDYACNAENIPKKDGK